MIDSFKKWQIGLKKSPVTLNQEIASSCEGQENIFRKTGTKTVVGLIKYAIENKLID
jgi:hypothetical protein